MPIKVQEKAQLVITFFIRNLKKISETFGNYSHVIDFSLSQLVEITTGGTLPINLSEYLDKTIDRSSKPL